MFHVSLPSASRILPWVCNCRARGHVTRREHAQWVTQARYEIINMKLKRTRRVRAEPMVHLSHCDLVERQVRVWCDLDTYYDLIAC